MKIHLEQIKSKDKFQGGKKASSVDSEFLKTCDELVIGPKSQKSHSSHGAQCWSHIALRSTKMGVRYDPTIYSGQRFLNCRFFSCINKTHSQWH